MTARTGAWLAIAGAIIATLTFVHNGLSQVEKIPGIVAQIDSLKSQAVIDRAWKHDMAYMACVSFQTSHTANEVPAVCQSATK